MYSTLRKTPAREAIIEYLTENDSPSDVSGIIKYLHSKNLNTNKVTVYRNLENLHNNGKLDKLEFGEGKFRYELKKRHHHHLICTNCGRVEDIEGDFITNLEKKIRKEKDFLVKSHSLEFFGVCKKCQQ